MTPRGKQAWLITWEGPESQHNGRCKIVAILRPQLGEKTIMTFLPVLFASEYNHTLGEKMAFMSFTGKDPYFKKMFQEINVEMWYGHHFKDYLCARLVKNLRCEDSNKDCHDCTLYWTELSRFEPNPKNGLEGPTLENFHDSLREIRVEREVQYTYSNRSKIEEEIKKRGNAHG